MASRRRGYSDRARPSVPRVREHVHWTPRRFTREDQLVEILAVVDQWRRPDHRYFRVATAAGETYILRHDVRSGAWELMGSDRSDPR
ncbi:MAG: hypothetical protein MK486_21240 [Gemmatimonadetes bacterium]|nr:hypothetical protein [Gemmatimonadota bacterium]